MNSFASPLPTIDRCCSSTADIASTGASPDASEVVAAQVSITPRACIISAISRPGTGATNAPRCGTSWTRSSAASISSASRTGVREIPTSVATACSLMNVPETAGSLRTVPRRY